MSDAPSMTPGPWHQFDNGGVIREGGPREVTYGPTYADCVWGPRGPGYGLVADCSPNGQPPSPETIANARAIAALPDMLAALKRAKAEAVADEMDGWFADVVAAIAKAEGGE